MCNVKSKSPLNHHGMEQKVSQFFFYIYHICMFQHFYAFDRCVHPKLLTVHLHFLSKFIFIMCIPQESIVEPSGNLSVLFFKKCSVMYFQISTNSSNRQQQQQRKASPLRTQSPLWMLITVPTRSLPLCLFSHRTSRALRA